MGLKRCGWIRTVSVFGAAVAFILAMTLGQAYAVGGYWKPAGNKPYAVKFTDEAKNTVVGEFKKPVSWNWVGKGKVKVDEWDDQATFVFKDKKGKDHKIPNAEIKKRILDLSPGFTGQLRGNIQDAVK